MTTLAVSSNAMIWKETKSWWLVLLLTFTLVLISFFEGLRFLVQTWGNSEEYSYGYLVPFISLFFVWHQWPNLKTIEFKGSWVGFALVIFGVALLVVGELATLYILVQYAFLVVVAGIVLASFGWLAVRTLWAPLLVLAFMIPLPEFLYQGLSANLQLISSELGVAVIRFLDISVSLEGNVIDLGTYKLQVVDACSGLRYLFPLMTFGFIAAYLYQVALWKRVLVFFSTIPITVLMNSFRIGVIGVTVDRWGPEMADGFLHDFEGWVVFMACTGILFLEMWLLTLFGEGKGGRKPFSAVFGLPRLWGTTATAATIKQAKPRAVQPPLIGGMFLLAVIAGFMVVKPERPESVPQRSEFVNFPLSFSLWEGQPGRLEKIYVDALKFDDYLLADYRRDGRSDPVNFYVAYYGSQKKGQSTHSPRSCIPGGGWRIASHDVVGLSGAGPSGETMMVNRVFTEKGEERQLVYYWFQQRGRVITNEYLVKWYLFWDSLTRNRSDGALVRLTTMVRPNEDVAVADALLSQFAEDVRRELRPYIPN